MLLESDALGTKRHLVGSPVVCSSFALNKAYEAHSSHDMQKSDTKTRFCRKSRKPSDRMPKATNTDNNKQITCCNMLPQPWRKS